LSQPGGLYTDDPPLRPGDSLRTFGEFTVPVKLHKEVTAHLKVIIEKEAVAE
jgi:ribosomal protein L9